MGGRSPRLSVDLAVAATLAAATSLYLAAMPQDLGFADESFFLYEARRLSEGEVLYRDVFELVAPLSWYAMAALFAVFGATMETARGSTAVLHGLIAATVYVCCRRLGIARGLAVAAAAAHVALCQPVWPYASPHWFGTFFNVALLAALLGAGGAGSPSRAWWVGLVGGILVGVQQQKGVVLGAGVAVALVADHWIQLRYSGEPWRALALRLGWCAAGALAVIVPVFGTLAVLAGTESLYESLVRFPLLNYRGTYRSAWAATTVLTRSFGAYTLPPLLAALPLALLGPSIDGVVRAVRRIDRERVRACAVLAVIGSFSILSIAYYPDLLHVAYVAPVLFIALAYTLDVVLASFPLAPWPRRIATVAFLAGLALQLGANLSGRRSEFPVSYDSAFGRIDLREARDIPGLDEIRRLLDATPAREIFAYPGQSFVYLVAGGNNPTRFQFFSPVFNDPAQIEEVLSVLEAKKLTYVLSTAMFRQKGDPIRSYLRDNYERLRLSGSPRFWLLRRRLGF